MAPEDSSKRLKKAGRVEAAKSEEAERTAKEARAVKERIADLKLLLEAERQGEPVAPGILRKAHDREIVKKSTIRKNRYIFYLPLKLQEHFGGVLGSISGAGTLNPSLYLDFPEGRFKCQGTILFPAARKYCLLKLAAGKVFCEDVHETLVVFADPIWVGKKEENAAEKPLPLPESLHDSEQRAIELGKPPLDSHQSGELPASQVSQPARASQRSLKRKAYKEADSDDDSADESSELPDNGSEGDYDAKPPEGTRDEVIAATEEDSDAISAEKDPGKRGRDDSRGAKIQARKKARAAKTFESEDEQEPQERESGGSTDREFQAIGKEKPSQPLRASQRSVKGPQSYRESDSDAEDESLSSESNRRGEKSNSSFGDDASGSSGEANGKLSRKPKASRPSGKGSPTKKALQKPLKVQKAGKAESKRPNAGKRKTGGQSDVQPTKRAKALLQSEEEDAAIADKETDLNSLSQDADPSPRARRQPGRGFRSPAASLPIVLEDDSGNSSPAAPSTASSSEFEP